MAKLDALKEKLAGLRQKLTEKIDSIPFLKKMLAKPAPAADTTVSPARSGDASLGKIYRGGGTLTRLQVLGFFLFLSGAMLASAFVAKRVFVKLRDSGHGAPAEEVTHGIGDIKRRMEENASVLSLGKFTVSTFVSEKRETAMGIDIWLRVSGVDAANFVQSHEVVLHDKTMDAMNELYMQHVNLLTEQGKEAAKDKIRDFLNQAIPKGKVEEVYFYNMVVQ